MNTVETIHQKVLHLPPRAQEEVLDAVEHIEERYRSVSGDEENGRCGSESKNFLELLAEIQINGPPDLAARHDFYAHGKVED